MSVPPPPPEPATMARILINSPAIGALENVIVPPAVLLIE
jgi:hypothetical protein